MSNAQGKEIFRQYSGALEPCQMKLAFGSIKRFKLPPHTWDDVMQDMAINLWSYELAPVAQVVTHATIGNDIFILTDIGKSDTHYCWNPIAYSSHSLYRCALRHIRVESAGQLPTT